MEVSKSKIGKYALLRHKKWRDKERLFLVQGRKAVEDTLPFYEIEALIEDPEVIKRITTLDNLPDIIAVYKMPVPQNEDKFRINPDAFTLLLDGIQDPGNMGTIIRTSHWFGINDIFCSPDSVDIYNPKTVMSTMGSIARVNVRYVDLVKLLEYHSEIPVYGLLLEGRNIFTQNEMKPGFILMGSEGHGPSGAVREKISTGLTIPPVNPSDHPDSLNVAIATAITLSQLLK